MNAIDLPFYPAFGFRHAVSAENVEYLQGLYSAGRIGLYLWLIHPQLSCLPAMPARGLAHEPQAWHADARWRQWRDEYLAGLAEAFPESPAIPAARREVCLVLDWRADVPAKHRYWLNG